MAEDNSILSFDLYYVQDTPGFIVNRLLVPFLAEAIRMLERGMHDQSINHLLLTIQRTNVNVTQHNMSRTERLKSTNSCPEKMKINL